MLVCIIILWKMFDRHLLYYPTPKKRKKKCKYDKTYDMIKRKKKKD